jgi:endonuclease/exonuclease/phosphatase (EEP) superfamily protein YafD
MTGIQCTCGQRHGPVQSAGIGLQDVLSARPTGPLNKRRAVLTTIGLAAFIMALLAFIARLLPITNHFVLLVAAVSPYLMLGAPGAVLFFALGKRWFLTAAAVAVTIAAVVSEVPLYTPKSVGNAADSVRLRVMTANLYLSQADLSVLVRTAEAQADVLALQELTPQAVEQLSAAGLDRTFPYRVTDARNYASGGGLWSRFPMTESTPIWGFALAMVTARIHVDGVAADPTIVNAHLAGPWPQAIDGWAQELKAIPKVMQDAMQSAAGGCVVVAGDFNATFDMQPFRALLQNGFGDAADRAGAGITATYPANQPVPPFIAIDHVLTHQCSPTSVETVELPGSDHRGLISVIDVPRSSTGS